LFLLFFLILIVFLNVVKIMMTPYEETRQMNIEENNQKLKALNLPSLSQSLRKSSSATSKPSSVSNNLSIYLLFRFFICCFYHLGLVNTYFILSYPPISLLLVLMPLRLSFFCYLLMILDVRIYEQYQ
jgi:hypothetical protein